MENYIDAVVNSHAWLDAPEESDMTEQELIAYLAERHGLSLQEAQRAFDQAVSERNEELH